MYISLYSALLFIVFILSIRKPAIAFGYMFCTFAIEQWFQSKDVFFIENTSFINITSGFIILIALAITYIKKGNIFKDIPTTARLVLALYIYTFISTVWSPAGEIALHNTKFAIPYFFLSAIFAPLLLKETKDFTVSFNFISTFGFFLIILLLFFTNWEYRTLVLAGNFSNLKTNPLAIANFSGYVFIIAMLTAQSRWMKQLKWIIGIVCLVISVKTGSRGQFIFMALCALIFTPMAKPSFNIKNLIPFLFGATFLLALSYLIMTEFSGTDTRWSTDKLNSDFSNRLEAAIRLLQFWIKSPISILFGLGSSASFHKDIFGFYVHIVPLEILGEEGIIGFSLYLLILVKSFLSIKRLERLTKNCVEDRVVLATISALLLFELSLSTKQGSFLSSTYLFSLIIILSRYELFISNKNSQSLKT